MDNLKDIRNKIDYIDEQMQNLFIQRMECSQKIAFIKQQNNINVFDQKREKEVIEQNIKLLTNETLKPYYQKFLTELMGISKEYQKDLLNNYQIGYQGTAGAFSYLSAQALFPNSRYLAFPNFEDVFKAVINGSIDFGVVPLENSYAGVVGEVLDLLTKYNLTFQKVYEYQVKQNLVALPGTKIENITDLYSHEQAFQQASKFLKNRPFNLHEFSNTALAAKFVWESGDSTKAAIASSETAKLYNLEILAANINTTNNNITRFIVISKDLKTQGNRYNLSFSLTNEVGSLSTVINTIAKHNFSMERIQSRPVQDIPWEYCFHLEIVGNLNSLESKKLLSVLETQTKSLKITGCYYKEEK